MNNSDDLATLEQPDSKIVYPKNVRVVGGESIVQFSNVPNGSTLNIGSTTINGAMVLVDPDPTANTCWFANHGLTQGDLVKFGSSSTSVPGGLSRNQYYVVYPVNANRIKFQQYNSTAIRELTSQGSTSATIEISNSISSLMNLSPRLSKTDLEP